MQVPNNNYFISAIMYSSTCSLLWTDAEHKCTEYSQLDSEILQFDWSLLDL